MKLSTQTGACPITITMVEKTYIFDANLQKQLLSEYDQKSKIKSQKWAKLIADKKSLTTIIYGQCYDATRTNIVPGGTYEADLEAGNTINVLKQLCTVCYGSVNGALSFKLYKQVVSAKSLNNFSNTKLHDLYSFKEELKIKYDAVLAVVRKFPNRIGIMMELLKVEPIPLT